MIAFSSLCFSGGALKTLCIIGALEYLEYTKSVSNVKNIIGTSAGAIVSFLFTIGYTSIEMKKFAQEILTSDHFASFDALQVCDLLDSYGIDSGERLEEMFRLALKRKMNRDDITFMELAKITGKNLIVCVCNLSKETTEYWNVDNKPNTSVIKALRVSCTLPFVYTPMMMNGDMYVDGSLYDNFPIKYFEGKLMKDIFGVNITANNYQKTDTFLQYMTFILFTMIEKMNYKPINDVEKNIVTVDFTDDEFVKMDDLKIIVTDELINKYISLGYESTKKRLEDMLVIKDFLQT
jgi:predicted acylesterase/phospholipase RssA